jgi:hypothetical protein
VCVCVSSAMECEVAGRHIRDYREVISVSTDE